MNPQLQFDLRRNFVHEARKRFRMVRWGIVSEKRLGEIFETCCETLEWGKFTASDLVDRPVSARYVFEFDVRQRLPRSYGFDPFTIILIAKLVLLFIELFLKFTGSESGNES